jgi:hypothetical protein
MGNFVVQAILFVASTAYQISQQRKAKARAAAEADKRKGFQITVSGEAAPLPVVYGKNVLGGIEVKHRVTSNFNSTTDTATKTFAESFSNSNVSGTKNEFMHVQYALCTEGIEGVQWVRINGQHYNESSQKFQHLIRTFANGGSADPIATANGIPATNTFTKTAFASATYRLNRDDQNYNGIPQAEFLVKGRKVKVVEESGGTYSLSTNSYYSNNPALCLLDYIMNEHGRNLSASYIDLGSFYHAAQVCDTVVATDRNVAGKVNSQKTVYTVADEASRPVDLEDRTYENELWYATAEGTYWQWNRTAWVSTTQSSTRPIPLYECNIALSTQEQVRDNIERIMSTMGLAELTWSSEGKYKLLLEYPTSLAETESLVDAAHEFTDDDIIRDNIEISWPSASDRLSQATVSFPNEHEDFKQDTVTWPNTGSLVHNTYLTEDNNQPFTGDVSPEGVTDPYHALALAEQSVRKSRSMITVKITVSKKGLNLEPGDFININSTVANITNEVFRVESIEVNADFTVNLNCYKFDHEVLAWNISDDIAYTTPPTFDFVLAPPTLLSYTAGSGDILGTASGKLSWTAADDIAATEYLVEISADNGTTFTVLGTTRGTEFDVTGLVTGVYDFSVRTRSATGTYSVRATVENKTIQLTTVGRVAVIYADTIDKTDNTQSYTLGSNGFVAYYPYTGETPALPIRTGITFASFIGADGIPGTPGNDGVTTYTWVRYADNGTGATGFSNSPTGKDYIGFAFNKTTATESEIPGDYTWSLIKGSDGAPGDDGDDGDDGERGAGWWRYETDTSAATASLSNTALDAFFSAATGLSVTAGDRFIVVNTSDVATGYLRNNANTSWVQQAEFIDGNLLVNGTITGTKVAANSITADKMSVSSLDAISATIGTFKSATSGARVEIEDDVIRVYDSSNNLRARIGNLV